MNCAAHSHPVIRPLSNRHLGGLLALALLLFPGGLKSQTTAEEALVALEKAVGFFRTEVGYQGAYVYRYRADLSAQEGEGKAHPTTGWVQPPGTPAVGMAYLRAWRLTGSEVCLDAAVESASALVAGQLKSGGWASRFELNPEHRRLYAYRTDGKAAGKRNGTTFDDNKSQSALRLLMLVDEALEFRDLRIHEAVNYALERMLTVQYPNGAWPQRYDRPPDPDEYPLLHASYPDSWPRTFPNKDYRGYYTLNDNTMADIITMLFTAARIYGREDCRRAAENTGDFFLLAQMPEPQPGWAQQYNRDMHPAWARKFEPPAITGGESQGVIGTLLNLYRWTGEKRYLEPIPRALDYYESSLLEDGNLARFYELQTNRPLFFTKDYELTYSDEDLPTHYAFVVRSKLDRLRLRYERLLRNPPTSFRAPQPDSSPPHLTKALQRKAAEIIAAMDERGAWVESGQLQTGGNGNESSRVIESKTFIRNLTVLAEFIAAYSPEDVRQRVP